MARKWWTLLAACLATFMLLLDVTVVNVALPDIRRELGGSFTEAYAGWRFKLASNERPSSDWTMACNRRRLMLR